MSPTVYTKFITKKRNFPDTIVAYSWPLSSDIALQRYLPESSHACRWPTYPPLVDEDTGYTAIALFLEVVSASAGHL